VQIPELDYLLPPVVVYKKDRLFLLLVISISRRLGPISNMSWSFVALSIASYVLLCHFLRFQRVRQKRAVYPYKTRDSFARMTAQHAYEIQQYVFETEFPFTAKKALQFALFRYVKNPPGTLGANLRFAEGTCVLSLAWALSGKFIHR